MVRMAGQDDHQSWKSSTRGEQGWKEERERIATRNAAARKSGKQERETYERGRESARQAAEARRRSRMLRQRKP
jgi:hypothetical protein